MLVHPGLQGILLSHRLLCAVISPRGHMLVTGGCVSLQQLVTGCCLHLQRSGLPHGAAVR